MYVLAVIGSLQHDHLLCFIHLGVRHQLMEKGDVHVSVAYVCEIIKRDRNKDPRQKVPRTGQCGRPGNAKSSFTNVFIPVYKVMKSF